MFVISQGSPLTRFRRALAVRNGPAAYAAASELRRVALDDALALTLLLADQPDLFGRLSARWVTRFASEVREMRLHHVQLASAALAAVRPGEPAGAQALGDLCSSLGRDDLVAVVDDWLEGAGH
jgi:hypothetical protein